MTGPAKARPRHAVSVAAGLATLNVEIGWLVKLSVYLLGPAGIGAGGMNDQVDCCWLCLGPRNIGAGYAARPGSTIGRHHASRLWMRTGQDTGSGRLRGQDHRSPGSQVCAMAWKCLRWVALLLRRDRNRARVVERRSRLPFQTTFHRRRGDRRCFPQRARPPHGGPF